MTSSETYRKQCCFYVKPGSELDLVLRYLEEDKDENLATEVSRLLLAVHLVPAMRKQGESNEIHLIGSEKIGILEGIVQRLKLSVNQIARQMGANPAAVRRSSSQPLPPQPQAIAEPHSKSSDPDPASDNEDDDRDDEVSAHVADLAAKFGG